MEPMGQQTMVNLHKGLVYTNPVLLDNVGFDIC